MKKQYTYYLSCVAMRANGILDRATPILPGRPGTINTFGFTQQPIYGRSLQLVLDEFKKLTGVELSHSRVYREVVTDGLSSSVVPAWPALRNATLQPAKVAVVLVQRHETPRALQH